MLLGPELALVLALRLQLAGALLVAGTPLVALTMGLALRLFGLALRLSAQLNLWLAWLTLGLRVRLALGLPVQLALGLRLRLDGALAVLACDLRQDHGSDELVCAEPLL